mgnify:CR=1 FL=1
MRTINKLTKLVLSFLLVITCINFSIVQAEDGGDENYSEPTAVETISEEPASEPEQEVIPEEPAATEEIIVEEPVAEEPVVEEATPVEEEKQEEAAPEVIEEAKVEEENNIPEIEAEPATQEETVEPEVQQEAPVEPEVEKVETVEEVKVTVVVSYVDESDHPLTDPITGSYPTEYRFDENVDAFKSFDGYAFEKVIVNDDAKNTISKDDVQKNGLRITKDMTSLKLVYQKMNLESNENKEVIPEVTEEASEEAEPESNTNETELSAFDQTAFAGKVGVHASAAEGVLPKGARLIVEQVNRKAILNAVENTVSDNNKEMDSAVALDISIVDKDGNKIQPNGIVNITFVNPGVSGDEIKIYHVEDDASAVTEIANNTDSFDASHFSIYVIAGENPVPLATYEFIANGQTVSTQIVKSGDTLIAPTAPDVAGQAFVGWVDEAGNPFTGFGKQSEITETTTRTITARYEAALYVYFYNPNGTKIMRTQKVADHEAHDYSSVTYDVDATHKLVGWAAEVNGTTDIAKNITVPTDKTSVNVYAIIKEGYWISFDSDGGSIVDSQFVLNGDKLTLNESTTPTKPGYTFDDWYDGSSKVENGATVTNPMTLKAHWNAAEVSYTVIHWWENADDDGYSFHESEELHGLTGKSTAALAKSYTTSGKNIRGESVEDKVFTATSISQKTIKGDGSTIVNVYYKRKTYTMHFKKKKSSSEDLSTITKKWGQSISKDEWPTYDENGNWQIREESYWNSARYIAFTSTMPMNDSILWTTSGSRTYTAYYYVQKITGNGYDLHHTDVIKGSGRLTIGHEDCYAISGFTFEYCNPDVGGSYNGAKFYYTRNSYDLKFINNGKPDKTVTKKYEQSISGENYTPTRPSSLPKYYVFDGWYENELCEGEAYNFTGQKMPAQNVTLYAKWTASDVKLTYNLNNPEGDVVKGTKKVEAGTIANTVLPSATTTGDYSFAGWYYADGNGNITSDAYNTNEAITKDTSVIGKWLYNGELKVVYDPGTEGTNAKVPTDSNIYAGGAKVTVAKNATTTSKMKFLGWKLKVNLYHPGDAFEVNKDLANDDNVITLTAIWGSEESSTTMSYDPGNGRGSVQTVPVKNNESVTLKSEKDLGYQAPEKDGKEYYFAGWATSMDDANNGKATYAAGQSVHVDVNGENVLYATWIEKTVITLVANSSVGNKYDGTKKEVSGFQPLTNSEYTVEGLTAHAEGTDAGVYETEITGTPIVKLGDNDVTDRVVVKTQKGQLTISKRDVTLTSASDEKVYDRTPLTNHSVTPSGDGFAKDEGATYDFTGSQTDVGESDNSFTYTLNRNTNPDNYNIKVVSGKLKVTPFTDEVTVTITGNTDTKTYDGNKHSVEDYTVDSISNPLYVQANIRFTGNAKAEGTDAGEYPMGLEAADFANKNTNFTNVKFTVEDGKLVINPRQVTLTSETASKKYDGEALTKPDVTVTDDGFVDGEVSEIKATGSVTNVSQGKVTNTITFKPEANFKADNYSIEKSEGKLSIIPVTDEVTVTIKGNTDTATYDGNSHSVSGYTVESISDPLYVQANIEFTGNAKAEGIAAGTYHMNLSKNQFSNTNTNFKNVKFSVTDGYLTINPKSINPEDEKTGIKVTNPDDTMYNGEEQKNKPTVEDTKTGATLVENVDYELSYTAAVNAGTVTVTITGKGNYTGTANTSYEITKRNVTLTSGSASKVYDKKALTKNEVTVSGDGFAKEEGATYNVTGSQTEKGSSDNEFTYTLKSNTKASNYSIEVKFGELKVTAEDGEVVVTITGHKETFDYDGNEKSVVGYDVSITEGSTYTTDDFTFNGNAEVKKTAAGTYPMELKVTDFTNTNSNYKKVTFVVNDGYLKINPKSIVPDGPDTPDEKKTGIKATDPSGSVYDGNPHLNTLTVKDNKTNAKLEENKDYTLSYSDDVVNVGTVTVTVKGTGNYTGEFTKKYQITPREYTVTTDGAEKVYDGNPLTAGGHVNNLVKDESVKFTVTGTQTNVGSSDNTYTLKWEGTAKASNYTHGKDSIGTLKVTAKSIVPDKPDTPEDKKNGITVTDPLDSTYDGKEHRNTPFVEDKKTNATLKENTDYTLTHTGDLVNVGIVKVTVKGIGNYQGSFELSYKITKRKVSLTSANAEKVYDGKPLTNATVTVTSKLGFAEKEGATYNVTGTITDVGTKNNTFTYTLNEGTLASNYDIETHEGTLKVTPVTDKVTVKISGKKATVTYDGKSHIVEGYDVNEISNPLYNASNIEFTGAAKAEGTEVNTYPMRLTSTQFSNTSKNFADVKFVVTDGSLTIAPKSIIPEDEKTGIKVTNPADSKYDGEEHRNKPIVTDTKTGVTLVENKDYTLAYSDNVIDAGEVTVTIIGANNYTGRFNVTYHITQRSVTLTSGSASKVYDKKALTKSEVTVSGDGFAKDEGATYKVTGSQTEKGSSKNTFTFELKSNTKASNYSIEVKFGELKVTAEDGEVVVTITGHKETFKYDGNEKSVDGYDVSITQGSTYTTEDFTFNGNAEVKETAAGTYPMGLQVSDFTNNNANYSTVTFVVNDGSLTINPKSIVPDGPDTPDEKKTGIEVSEPSDSEYDGNPHVNPIAVRDAKTNADLVENTDFTLTYSDDTTNVGTVIITVKGIGNYTGEFTKTYEITPRPYTVTTESDEKVYDGTPLTAGGSIDGIVEGDDVEVRTTGKQINVGESKNTYELVWKGARKDNYQLKEETLGTLKVTEQSIDPGKDPDNPNPSYVGVQVNAPENHVYDGKDHQWIPEVLDKENQPLTAGTDYTVTYTDDSGKAKDDFTNVTGTIHVTISGKGNYTGSVTREYEITKRSVKLTSETDEKEFDGMPLTRPVVKIEGDGFVDDEVSDVKAVGTVTSVEESPAANKITYVTHEAFKYDNYNIELNEGTLTITPKSIIPDGPHTPDDKKTGITVENPADVKYDGKEHAEKPIVKDEKTGATLKEGKDYEIVYPEDIVNAGEITATVNGKGNYDGSFEIKYNILKRDVTFTSATDSKKYDGTALTNGNVEITGDGFAEGEGATFNVTGTITNTGSTENTFTFELNEGTLASNYNIEANAGTLTITPKSIIPDGPHTPDDKKTGITVENPADVKYDGKEHAQKPIVRDEKTGVTLEEGKDYEIVYPTDIKNAGTVTATVKGIGDYNGSFEIKYNILKRDVTFTSATDSKQYDGNAFTNGSVEITGDGFVEGEGVTFNVTGSITDAGSTKNTFTYVMHAGTNAGNYNVTVVEGTLTVTAAPVVPRQPETPQNPPARPSRPNVPARIVTQPTTTTPAPEATVEPAKVEPTPAPTAKPEKIKEEATPQAAVKGHWALINLIAAMLSVVLAVAALLAKHAKEEDEEDKDDQVVESENQDDETVTSKRHRTWKIVAVVDAIAAVVVFILTENLAHNMVLVDKWTVLMVLFGLISIVSTYFARKWHEEDEDEDEQSSQNA